jgi:transposase-like protein
MVANPEVSEVTQPEDQAVMLLAAGKSMTACAEQVGISRKTLYNWRQDPAFKKRVADLRSEMFDEATGQMVAGAGEAAATILSLALKPHSNAAVRLNACKAVLGFVSEHQIVAELEARLEAIEAAV